MLPRVEGFWFHPLWQNNYFLMPKQITTLIYLCFPLHRKKSPRWKWQESGRGKSQTRWRTVCDTLLPTRGKFRNLIHSRKINIFRGKFPLMGCLHSCLSYFDAFNVNFRHYVIVFVQMRRQGRSHLNTSRLYMTGWLQSFYIVNTRRANCILFVFIASIHQFFSTPKWEILVFFGGRRLVTKQLKRKSFNIIFA